MKNICTILARGGSKGLENKNIKKLHGKPLIHYTIIQALESKLFDCIVISSDSDEILSTASMLEGVEIIKRPKEFANSTVSKRPGIRHAICEMEKKFACEFDNVIDLDPTSPLREVTDILNAFGQFTKNNNDNLITAMPARRSPYFNMVKVDSDSQVKLVLDIDPPVTCRQDAPECFDMNASIYIWKKSILYSTETNYLTNTGLYIMPEERSIDIDNAIDFEFVEFVMGKKYVEK